MWFLLYFSPVGKQHSSFERTQQQNAMLGEVENSPHQTNQTCWKLKLDLDPTSRTDESVKVLQ
jgi:hypothetical protein